MRSVLFFSLALLFTACNSQPDKSSAEADIQDSTSTTFDSSTSPAGETAMNSISSGCYLSIFKKDTAMLNLTVSGTDVSGDLNYSLYQKDKNKGSLKGTFQNELIVADYTFQAEGMTSVRQVAFKKSGDSLIEGYGDIEMKGDTARFKDVDHLKFHEDRPFAKTDCK
ncbi:MAG: hypothetical protein ABI683_10065 [Ginsengibacter sp.]